MDIIISFHPAKEAQKFNEMLKQSYKFGAVPDGG